MAEGKRIETIVPNRPITGVYSLPRVQAIFMAGQETGIPVNVKAEAGEKYPLENDGTHVVSEGHAYVEIGTGAEGDLGKFWKRVDKIKKHQRT